SANLFVSKGDTLGGMTVANVSPFNPEAGEIAPDNVKINLSGPITVTGKYRHVSSAIGFDGYCMSGFNEASLKILPSLPGEKRQTLSSFCFRNVDTARKLLGEESKVVSVKIDNYELNAYPSEVIDWVDIVGIVK
ncbi:MAG: hypothetical protein Q7S86_00955, partial [bacterium]|nr:hypothetical protein [bacterium]